jgi:glycerol-3-phosphate O-acyltransferase / dihydroxyacetone phosphate acyltransferase
MWLLPAIDRLAVFASTTYYRLKIDGEPLPASGPVLLVANHPNSLMDPALVISSAGRPVRFLAKAPLFRDPVVGWLVRGAGSIPVYRVQDDPSQMARNDDAFRAAHDALAADAAVGIFPEGISHDNPALAPMKTGAARIALGAAGRIGVFPIVPVGLSFRARDRFRSDALVRVGAPVPWEDLADGPGGSEQARELTRRIAAALADLTLNLGSWEDAPLVRWAAEIHAAHHAPHADESTRFASERAAGRLLEAARAGGLPGWEVVARDVRRHAAVLEGLGLRPHELTIRTDARAAARWSARQLGFLTVHGLVGAAGSALFYVPYRLTGVIVDRLRLATDLRATYRVVGGGIFFAAWIALIVGVVAWSMGLVEGLVTLAVLPPLAIYTRRFHDRWQQLREQARQWIVLRPRERLRARLLRRQQALAERLEAVRIATAHEPDPPASVSP